MNLRWLLASLIGVALVVSTLELSCVAAERLAASPAAPVGLFTGGLEPELPGVPEAGAVESVSPTYTR